MFKTSYLDICCSFVTCLYVGNAYIASNICLSVIRGTNDALIDMLTNKCLSTEESWERERGVSPGMSTPIGCAVSKSQPWKHAFKRHVMKLWWSILRRCSHSYSPRQGAQEDQLPWSATKVQLPPKSHLVNNEFSWGSTQVYDGWGVTYMSRWNSAYKSLTSVWPCVE